MGAHALGGDAGDRCGRRIEIALRYYRESEGDEEKQIFHERSRENGNSK